MVEPALVVDLPSTFGLIHHIIIPMLQPGGRLEMQLRAPHIAINPLIIELVLDHIRQFHLITLVILGHVTFPHMRGSVGNIVHQLIFIIIIGGFLFAWGLFWSKKDLCHFGLLWGSGVVLL